MTSTSIPRKYVTHLASVVHASLHGFSDASKEAYGATVYIQSVHHDNTISTSLVISKARVASLKGLTIPRAELTEVYLRAKLLHYCSHLLDISEVSAWTDSSIVLCWLRKLPSSLHTFVGNRVAAIQELLPEVSWRHVPSSSNPADILSKGSNLKTSKGPPWLR